MTTYSPDSAFVAPLPDAEAVVVGFAGLDTTPVLGARPDDHAAPAAAPAAASRRLSRRLWRGREDDPAWVRPSLLALLASTAVLYLWGLSASGWANAFYSAAVQAGSQSWKAMLFGSSDAANFITVDKPPASLWPMEISARIFGVSSWSILVPQALMGVGSVALLYAAVRRWSTPAAGLVAGAVLALTPVATLMFRFNNPDALLVLLLTAAAYTTVRATERASTRWLLGTGALLGLAFLTKSMQAFLVLPAFSVVYLLAAPTTLRRRLLDLLAGGAAIVVSAGWWIALVELWPADSRPYIGGSQTNSVLELILGYNGLGRITGDETGSVVGGGGQGSSGMWGETGLGRLFSSDYGGQVAWLIPTSLVLAGVVLWLTRRASRTDRTRASVVLWLGWLLVTGLTISFAQGIIHSYYTVALAPAIGALVGIGAVELWRRREHLAARATAALVLLGTGVWSAVLLGRSSEFVPWLRIALPVVATVVALGILVSDRLPHGVAALVVSGALLVGLAGPAAYSVQTASSAHTGSLPSAGPTVAGSGPGGMRGPGGLGGFGGTRNGTPPGFAPNGQAPTIPGGTTTGAPSTGGQSTGGLSTGGAGMPGGGGGGAGGGLLEASTPSSALVTLLSTDAGSYTWVAAAVGAQTAAGYQLATGDPVMSLGGFNGSDPWPTLAVFQDYVAQGKVHYFIAGGGMGGPGGGTTTSATSEITSWVEKTFTSTTVDGVTVYDLTQPASATGA